MLLPSDAASSLTAAFDLALVTVINALVGDFSL
jgi:hypothetical protein